MLKGLTCVSIFVISGFVQSNEQISQTDIVALAIYETYAIATLAESGQNTDQCTRNGAENYIAIEFDSATGKEMFSAVLSARIAGQQVGFGAAGCKNWGATTIPLAYRIDL